LRVAAPAQCWLLSVQVETGCCNQQQDEKRAQKLSGQRVCGAPKGNPNAVRGLYAVLDRMSV
jgi:hypothetical protein